MIYVLLPRLKNKKQEIWTIQTHERAIVFTIKANGDVGRNASVRTKERRQNNEKVSLQRKRLRRKGRMET